MTIYAETERLVLRALEKKELSRLVELIGQWDVVKWLSVVPFPYTTKDAEDFFADVQQTRDAQEPPFYVMALKSDNLLIGGLGLHPPRNTTHDEGDIELGYWLGKSFWGQGLMQEAAQKMIDVGFGRRGTSAIGANTDPSNFASQKVLQKVGLRNLGLMPKDYKSIRGPEEIIKWRLTRAEWEQGKKT